MAILKTRNGTNGNGTFLAENFNFFKLKRGIEKNQNTETEQFLTSLIHQKKKFQIFSIFIPFHD